MIDHYKPLPVTIWVPINQPVGRGYAPERPWTVQKTGEWFTSNGRVHRYKTEARAQKVADMLNLGESVAATKREKATP